MKLLRRMVLALIATSVPVLAQTQPVPGPALSLDVLVRKYKHVVIGFIESIAPDGTHFVMKIEEVLAGDDAANLTVRHYGGIEQLEEHRTQNMRVALFYTPGVYATFILAEADAYTSFYRKDFSIVRGYDKTMSAVREILNTDLGPAGRATAVLPFPNGVDRPRAGATGGRLTGLAVPIEESLLPTAERWLADPQEFRRRDAVKVIRHFKSDRNIRLLKSLLDDPSYYVDKYAHSNFGIERRNYIVREDAYDALQNWGVEVDKPTLHESVPMYDTTESLRLVNVTDETDLGNLGKFKALRHLAIHGNGISKSAIDTVSQLKGLTVLQITCEGLRDEDLRYLTKLKELHSLDIRYTSVTDYGLIRLVGMLSLANLYTYESNVTESGIRDFLALRPDVQVRREPYALIPDPPER